jgi:hypothetical protein
MSFDAEEFVHYQIANAAVRRHPFAHFFVQPVFPADYYVELLERLPPRDWFKPIDETGAVAFAGEHPKNAKAYPSRYIADVADIEEREQQEGRGTFWLSLSQWLMSDRFRGLILEKFREDIPARFGEGAKVSTDIDARLVRDFTDYAIGPHTDSPRKLVSLLFYLPQDDSMRHLGTTIYAPASPGFRDDSGKHYQFKGFKRVASMPFVPNALFAFFKTDRSFHGVDTIADAGIERNLLLYNIYVQAVATRRAGFRWPWQRGRRWTVFKSQQRD